jgi:hypothetical protein
MLENPTLSKLDPESTVPVIKELNGLKKFCSEVLHTRLLRIAFPIMFTLMGTLLFKKIAQFILNGTTGQNQKYSSDLFQSSFFNRLNPTAAASPSKTTWKSFLPKPAILSQPVPRSSALGESTSETLEIPN